MSLSIPPVLYSTCEKKVRSVKPSTIPVPRSPSIYVHKQMLHSLRLLTRMISNGLRDKKILKRIYELSSRALIKKYNAMNTLLAFSKGETDQGFENALPGFENALPSIAIDDP